MERITRPIKPAFAETISEVAEGRRRLKPEVVKCLSETLVKKDIYFEDREDHYYFLEDLEEGEVPVRDVGAELVFPPPNKEEGERAYLRSINKHLLKLIMDALLKCTKQSAGRKSRKLNRKSRKQTRRR
jgi:hypothetical protein